MSNPSWLKPEQSNTAYEPLPVGAYVGKILGAKRDDAKGMITIQLDVTEGVMTNYYQKDYEAQKGNSKVTNPYYKGTVTLWIPKGDGSQNDQYTISSFNRTIGAVEESNEGYHFDFDVVGALRGKNIGFVVREYHGISKTGKPFETTEPAFIISVDYAKSGKAKIPKAREHKEYQSAIGNAPKKTDDDVLNGFTQVDNDEVLPF